MITRVDLCGLFSNLTSVDPKIRERKSALRIYSPSTPNNDALRHTRTRTLQGPRPILTLTRGFTRLVMSSAVLFSFPENPYDLHIVDTNHEYTVARTRIPVTVAQQRRSGMTGSPSIPVQHEKQRSQDQFVLTQRSELRRE